VRHFAIKRSAANLVALLGRGVLGSSAGRIVAWKSLRDDPVNAVGPTAIMLNDFVSLS